MRNDPSLPDHTGHFGQFGGRFVPETLMHALTELEAAYKAAQSDPEYRSELDDLLNLYVGDRRRSTTQGSSQGSWEAHKST